MSEQMNVEIKVNGFGKGTIFLNDQEVTDYVRAVTLFSTAREMTVVGLELINVNVVAEGPAILQGMIPDNRSTAGDAVRALNPSDVEEAALSNLGMGEADTVSAAILQVIAKELDDGAQT